MVRWCSGAIFWLLSFGLPIKGFNPTMFVYLNLLSRIADVFGLRLAMRCACEQKLAKETARHSTTKNAPRTV